MNTTKTKTTKVSSTVKKNSVEKKNSSQSQVLSSSLFYEKLGQEFFNESLGKTPTTNSLIKEGKEAWKKVMSAAFEILEKHHKIAVPEVGTISLKRYEKDIVRVPGRNPDSNDKEAVVERKFKIKSAFKFGQSFKKLINTINVKKTEKIKK